MSRVTRADRGRWWAAQTLLDLGRLTARWLEGEIGSQPGYQPGYGPDVETEPLVETLARANRAGFLTQCSQPGYQSGDGPDAGAWAQRAAVTGFLEERRATALAAEARKAGFEVILDPPAARVSRFAHPGESWIPVTTLHGELQTSFGGFWTRRRIRRFYGPLCNRTALRAIAGAAQLTIVDPSYATCTDLWDFLDDWARQQGAKVAELDEKRAEERTTTQLLAVLAAAPEATAYLTWAETGPSGYPVVLYLNTVGVLPCEMTRWQIHEQDLPLLRHVPWAENAYLPAFPADQTPAEAMELLSDQVQARTAPTANRGGTPWNTRS
ncbi:DUF6919 domain-containing protein [Amycolatopsis keratiniphila]|uniref:DUF6919 domain-containing protein n=1 Tax=Amycolatopsis keratiniphila TaxID=129921 RepID=W6HZH8_9PSEU|nr:hypothetical protein [Amycolatopsis keratiniphila]AHJ58532.1 hypothetical protein AORI_P017 [Amycolatopsis keratiniphila]